MVTPAKVPHRPYAVRGARKKSEEPSVTTVLKLTPKEGLPYGAARETSTFAVLHPDKWQHLRTEEAIDRIRRHFAGVWDGRAAMGTLAHAVNEAYCDGRDVDLEELVAHTIETDRNARTWKDRDLDDLIEQVLGYVLGLEKWWADFTPSHVQSEVVVRWPNLYIGQLDLRCQINGEDFLCDLKTVSHQEEDKGVYPESYALQLAAYGMAPETVHYALEPDKRLKPGHRVVEVGTGPWSRPQRYAVIHLRGDEEYTFYEIPVDRDVERTFLRLARAHPVVSRLSKVELARIGAKKEKVA